MSDIIENKKVKKKKIEKKEKILRDLKLQIDLYGLSYVSEERIFYSRRVTKSEQRHTSTNSIINSQWQRKTTITVLFTLTFFIFSHLK